tara:strand:+ start:497 stop:1021 length:525 start_codon:yes stop_codon:yes gene_type:complete
VEKVITGITAAVSPTQFAVQVTLFNETFIKRIGGSIIMPQAFNAPGLPEPFGIFSGAAWEPEGKVLHISGYVSQDAEGNLVGVGDIKAQTRQVLKNIDTVLASVGANVSDIARVTVYITDMTMLSEIHEARAEYFERPYPASTLVEVSRLVRPEYLIEIDAVAVVPFDRAKDPS